MLSGGEQQMLTLCRTLMDAPDLIMIDEPTDGLAPQNFELVAKCPRQSPPAATCSVHEEIRLPRIGTRLLVPASIEGLHGRVTR